MATYYVQTPANGGNDSNDGSIGSPVASLSVACNLATVPYDVIHIGTGTFIETNQSILRAKVSIEGEGAFNTIIESHVTGRFTVQAESGSENTDADQYVTGIKMHGDSLTAYGAIRVAYRGNVRIYNNIFTDFDYYGVSFINGEPPTDYATNNKFYNNTVTNCSGYHSGNQGCLEIQGQDGMLIYNNIMSADRGGANCGDVIYAVEGFLKNVKIYNNTMTKTCIAGVTSWDFAVEIWNAQGGVEMYGNVIIGSIDIVISADKGASAYTAWIHDNIIGQPALIAKQSVRGVLIEYDCSDIVVERNYFHHIAQGIYLQQGGAVRTIENIDIRYNIFTNIGSLLNDTGWGIYWSVEERNDIANNINIWNNVFQASSNAYSTMYGIGLPDVGTATNVSVRNNIICNFDDSPIFASGDGGTTIDTLSIENNIFFGNGNSNDVKYVDGMSPTNDTTQNNLTDDPLFVSGSDFHLQVGSPAINAGIDVGLLTDYAGTAVSDPPEIGVYEFSGASTLVTSITVTGLGGATTITNYRGSLQMSAAVLPSDADIKTVTWSVVNGTGIGVIDSYGLLTAYGNGTVTVIATAQDGSSVSGSLVVTLSNQTAPPGSGLRDRDGNEYTSVIIGNQEWLVENLKVNHYADGTPISNLTADLDWINDTTGAFCYYDNNPANKTPYGCLYNWFAIEKGLAYIERNGVHETDWKMPSILESQELSDFLGGNGISGGKLKEIGFTHWNPPNTDATNESGFTSLGSGRRNPDGSFEKLLELADYWTSSEYTPTDALEYSSYYDDPGFVQGNNPKVMGYSVRLVRDLTPEPPIPPTPPEPPVPPQYDDVVPYSYGNIPTYRFYVNKSPSSITYEVFPLKFLSTTIAWELQKNAVFYRQKFNNSLLFGTNSKAIDDSGVEHNRREDWLLFWGFEQTDPYARLDFVITKTLGSSTTIYFEGYFSVMNGNFDIDNCTFEVTPLPTDDYTDILDEADTQHNILTVPAMGTVHAVHGDIDKDYTRTRWLARIGDDNVLEYLAQQTIGGAVTVTSDFFVNGTNYVTLDDNLLTYLTIAQKSDIIRNTSTDPASYAGMSWNELMTILWQMFQVAWIYDLTTNTIYVEHISYFTRAAGIDLRTQLTCVATNKYNYLKEEMPKFEKFSFMEADGDNFVGAFIWYNSPAVNQDNESNRVDERISVTTDLEYIVNNPEAIADEGFVILCNYFDGADYYVRMDSGKFVTTDFALNMNLSVANLHDAYFRHNRVLIEGYLNGVFVDFWSAQKTKQQLCNAILCDELDPMEEITTELGETYFAGAKANIKTVTIAPSGETKFTLLYGPPDNTNTGVPNIFSVEAAITVRHPVDPTFDEMDILYTFNTVAAGDITTRFRVMTFDDLGVLQDTSAWTTVTLLTGESTHSLLSHQIYPLQTGWTVSVEFEYPSASIDTFSGVPDATWSYYVPFIYTPI